MSGPKLVTVFAHAGLFGRSVAAALNDQFTLSPTVSLAQTLARLEQQGADLLLIDLDLPDAAGPAAVARVRRSFPNLPIVAVARGSGERTADAVRRAGASDLLTWESLAAMTARDVSCRLTAAVRQCQTLRFRPTGRLAKATDGQPLGAPLPETDSPPLARPLSCRVLLAEHQSTRRRALSQVIADAGAQIDKAVDGPMTLAKALAAQDRGRPYNVVLMNAALPGLGESPAICLREAGYRRPILCLETPGEAFADRLSVDEWLTAPVDQQQLLEALRRWSISDSAR